MVSVTERQQQALALLPAVRQTSVLSAEQQALRKAWNTLAEKVRCFLRPEAWLSPGSSIHF